MGGAETTQVSHHRHFSCTTSSNLLLSAPEQASLNYRLSASGLCPHPQTKKQMKRYTVLYCAECRACPNCQRRSKTLSAALKRILRLLKGLWSSKKKSTGSGHMSLAQLPGRPTKPNCYNLEWKPTRSSGLRWRKWNQYWILSGACRKVQAAF